MTDPTVQRLCFTLTICCSVDFWNVVVCPEYYVQNTILCRIVVFYSVFYSTGQAQKG